MPSAASHLAAVGDGTFFATQCSPNTRAACTIAASFGLRDSVRHGMRAQAGFDLEATHRRETQQRDRIVAQGKIIQRDAAADGFALAQEAAQRLRLLAPGGARQAQPQAAAFELMALHRAFTFPRNVESSTVAAATATVNIAGSCS